MNNFQYLGTSLKTPLRLVKGKPIMVTGIDNIRQSIERILSTPKGSVLFSRDYGSRLHEMLFEPNTVVASEMLRFFIFEAIRDFEKRVRFVSCETTIQDNTILCNISYRVLATNEVETLVYPFYRQV
jgi:phage baseplate assembly protein W